MGDFYRNRKPQKLGLLERKFREYGPDNGPACWFFVGCRSLAIVATVAMLSSAAAFANERTGHKVPKQIIATPRARRSADIK